MERLQGRMTLAQTESKLFKTCVMKCAKKDHINFAG